MKLGLLFCGDGRQDYLQQAILSVKDHLHHPVHVRMMVNDEADPAYVDWLNYVYPEYTIKHTGRVGMAGAVQAGFDLCVEADVDAVLWLEEDMILTRPVPVGDAYHHLVVHDNLAQMTFEREAWWGSDLEMMHGQRRAITQLAPFADQSPLYLTHDYLFSLNPCLIPKRVLALGYDSGNEAGFTKRLLDEGFRFGMWGSAECPTYARHIGDERSAQWRL